ERDKQVENRGGFLVMAARPWPSGGEGRGLFLASAALACIGLTALAVAGVWWSRHASGRDVGVSGGASAHSLAETRPRAASAAPAVATAAPRLMAPVEPRPVAAAAASTVINDGAEVPANGRAGAPLSSLVPASTTAPAPAASGAAPTTESSTAPAPKPASSEL